MAIDVSDRPPAADEVAQAAISAPRRYEVAGCGRKCSLSVHKLGSRNAELVHDWFEEGANRDTIITRARREGFKLTSGSVQRHKANHLVPRLLPLAPLDGKLGEPETAGEAFLERIVAMAVVQLAQRMEFPRSEVELLPDGGARLDASRAKIVYKLLDRSGRVLYVGRGLDGRQWEHTRKPWWPRVARVLVKKCASFGDSLVLESLLIRKYQPPYNVTGVTR